MPAPTPRPVSTPSLRWLSGNALRKSPSHSNSSSPTPSRPPSPALSSLKEALNASCLPAKPQKARLAPHMYPSRALARPPPLLNQLTRSTLPTSSLSPPSPICSSPKASSFDSARQSYGAITHSPPGRSSIDSLRRVSLRTHSRQSSYSAPSTPIPQPSESTDSFFSGWGWFNSENKDNVDALLNKDDRADTYREEQSKLGKKYLSPKNPVVFCHGLLGFDSVTIGPAIAPLQVSHWRGIKEVLEANGTEVLVTRVPATSSPVDRARVLEEVVSKAYPGRAVHLIGHSMGGLDCRFLTTHLTYRKFKVLSVTTVATPHRGSYFADYFLHTVGLERMPSVLSLLDLLPNGGGDGRAFEFLTVDNMRKFNEDTPDVQGVQYFSWGAQYEPGLIDTWRYPHGIILEKEGPNDGLVSVQSSKWGTYLGTLLDVNHLDLVGWINPARYKWAEMTGRVMFRPGTFYLGIADMLARDVEGQVPKEPEQSPKAGQGARVKDQPTELETPAGRIQTVGKTRPATENQQGE